MIQLFEYEQMSALIKLIERMRQIFVNASLKSFFISSSRKLEACSNLSRLNSFISTFKGFAKSVRYVALRFSKLGTTHLLHSEHMTSLQYHKTSIKRQDVAWTAVMTLCVR